MLSALTRVRLPGPTFLRASGSCGLLVQDVLGRRSVSYIAAATRIISAPGFQQGYQAQLWPCASISSRLGSVRYMSDSPTPVTTGVATPPASPQATTTTSTTPTISTPASTTPAGSVSPIQTATSVTTSNAPAQTADPLQSATVTSEVTIPNLDLAIAEPVQVSGYLNNCAVLLHDFHEMLGWGWFGTVAVLALSLRFVVSPLYILGRQMSVKQLKVQTERIRIQNEIRELSASKSSKDQEKVASKRAEFKDLMNFSDMGKMALLSILQMPVFATAFLSLRALPDVYPQEFAQQSILWIPSLIAADPSHILPILTAVLQFVSAEISRGAGKVNWLHWAVRAGICISPVIFWNFTALPLLYWIFQSVAMIITNLVLARPSLATRLKLTNAPTGAIHLKFEPAPPKPQHIAPKVIASKQKAPRHSTMEILSKSPSR